MKINPQKFTKEQRKIYLKDTLLVANAFGNIANNTDIKKYFDFMHELQSQSPFSLIPAVFDPTNIYPYYYFMPFILANGFIDNTPENQTTIQKMGLIATLIARKVIVCDLLTDHQQDQIADREMGDLKENLNGYYMQMMDCKIYQMLFQLFPHNSNFWSLYQSRQNEYLSTQLTEKNLSPLIGNDVTAFRQYATGKSALHLVVSDMLLCFFNKEHLIDDFSEMLRSYILLLTIQDDCLDILEDVKNQQPSHFYPWISGGEIVKNYSEDIEKALILKFFLGGGIGRTEAFLQQYQSEIGLCCEKIESKTFTTLQAWRASIDKIIEKSQARLIRLQESAEVLSKIVEDQIKKPQS